jgi:hypothetical protein
LGIFSFLGEIKVASYTFSVMLNSSIYLLISTASLS